MRHDVVKIQIWNFVKLAIFGVIIFVVAILAESFHRIDNNSANGSANW